MIGLTHYLILASLVFVIGLVGIMRRRNLIMLFFSSEILLNSANIALATISKYYFDLTGQIIAFFIVAIAASEVAVGLGLLVLWYKKTGSISLESMTNMKG
ncbi:NADH-quinone oxidoreductase subunit NuoK [Campylobacter concisus]|uniref:NADH-quinone oxidoreductase subunit NuoK n=1 Tax=Campylobacter concisus TaxID=199 RepID=UPI000D3CD46F|nr:NADH-quinone oxidoreductase subunit NuoK [Campylobacter concisus]